MLFQSLGFKCQICFLHFLLSLIRNPHPFNKPEKKKKHCAPFRNPFKSTFEAGTFPSVSLIFRHLKFVKPYCKFTCMLRFIFPREISSVWSNSSLKRGKNGLKKHTWSFLGQVLFKSGLRLKSVIE